jgi:DNA-binding transcriptional regulator YiaG
MSPLLETTTNCSLSSQAQGMSTVEDRLQSSTVHWIDSAIFTSDRSTAMLAEIHKRHFLVALNMTTSGVEIEVTIPKSVLLSIANSEFRGFRAIEIATLFVKSTQQAVNKLRKLSGLTWKQLATLFNVSRRSVHFWASGEALSSANQEKLNRTLDAVEYISRGSASNNRSLLMGIADDGKSYLELLASGEFDRVKHLLGAGNAPTKPKLDRLSPAAEMSRVPPNPADLVDALQDSIHQEVGKSRVAKSMRSRNK